MELFLAQSLNLGVLHLDKDESHHLAKVLRMKSGDKILLTDGRGLLAYGKVLDPHPKTTTLEVVELHPQSPPYPEVHLFISPTRTTERTEWLIEKATELGVISLHFVQYERTARSRLNLDRYRRISQAACKQSLNPFFPEITSLSSMNDAISKARGIKAVATCAPFDKSPISTISPSAEVISLFIGPEGDFTSSEIDTAIHCGATVVSLGTLRFRTETAALAALSFLRLRCL